MIYHISNDMIFYKYDILMFSQISARWKEKGIIFINPALQNQSSSAYIQEKAEWGCCLSVETDTHAGAL